MCEGNRLFRTASHHRRCYIARVMDGIRRLLEGAGDDKCTESIAIWKLVLDRQYCD
jgi:hypothetical protein